MSRPRWRDVVTVMGAFAVMFVGIDLVSPPLMITGLVVLVVFWHTEDDAPPPPPLTPLLHHLN